MATNSWESMIQDQRAKVWGGGGIWTVGRKGLEIRMALFPYTN